MIDHHHNDSNVLYNLVVGLGRIYVSLVVSLDFKMNAYRGPWPQCYYWQMTKCDKG